MSVNRIDVDASPHDVFAVLTDPEAYVDWVLGAKRVRAVDPEWPAPGSRFHHAVGAPGVELKDSTKILRIEPDRVLELQARFRPLGEALVKLELEPLAGGRRTRITMREEPKGKVPQPFGFVLDIATSARNALSLRTLARLGRERAARAAG
ncbi:MAG TPA: SRPBCC family protein [Acidimicrobiia bacterium]|jgi:uncharacterized protein YndB with AHSA1/START domain|nr:SRPBCC family protein [Acidimicrobiia bacterium]